MSEFTSPYQILNFGRKGSNWFGREWNKRGPFGRGEINTFAFLITIVGQLNQRFDGDDGRISRWSFSFGAILTDHTTFPNRISNYEHFWDEHIRIYKGK